MENWLVRPRTMVRRKAGRSRRWSHQFALHTADVQNPGFRPWRRVPDNGTSDWPGMARVGRDNAKTVMASLARSRLWPFRRCTIWGYMNHRYGLIRQSVLGLQSQQSLSNLVFSMALIISQLSWAA